MVLYAVRIDTQVSHCLLLLDAARSISLKRIIVAIRLHSFMKQITIRTVSILCLLANIPIKTPPLIPLRVAFLERRINLLPLMVCNPHSMVTVIKRLVEHTCYLARDKKHKIVGRLGF